MSVRNLDALFAPKSVAVIGASATPGRIGQLVLRNVVRAGFAGPIYPVNPRHAELAGLAAYPSVAALPEAPGLAVIATPAATVPGLIAELGARGTRAAVVLSAGLEAKGADGRRLDEAMLAAAKPHVLRVLGPNCVGLLVPGCGLDASFAHAPAAPGRLAFLSQSGALCTAVLDQARSTGVGFSAFVSLGNAADVDFGDLVDYLGSDADTDAILLYIESVRDARKFVSACRAAARNKPLVAVKAGRVREGARAAASHTGALAGADDVFDDALRRAGVLRVSAVRDLFDAVETLARSEPLRGERLAVLTNGGGPGVMAVDALVAGGGRLAELSEATLTQLDAALPRGWARANPIDVWGDGGYERHRAALSAVLDDRGVDALLVLHAPVAVVSADDVARAVVEAVSRAPRKLPVLTCWLGGEGVREARHILADGDVPSYETPEEAVAAFLHLVRHRRGQERLTRTPATTVELPLDPAPPAAAIANALAAGRGWLTGREVSDVLSGYGIPVVPVRAAADEDEAAEAAVALGLPAALKVVSPDVLHKSDVGGVALDLESGQAVRAAAAAMRRRVAELVPGARIEGFLVQPMARRPRAHELYVGAGVDPVFGPYVLFGQGGVAVEVVQDSAVALPPLDVELAKELISRTRIARLLAGYRDRPAADLDAIALVLAGVSRLVTDHATVFELDINPLLADERGVLALDARLRVSSERRTPLAIRPYPKELAEEWTLADGRAVLARPIRPDDGAAHAELHGALRPEDVRFRFFHHVRALAPTQLARFTQIDYDREMAFVALEPPLDGQRGRTLGVVRALSDPDGELAEYAIIVRPDVQGLGLGRRLMQKIIDYCRSRGVRVLEGHVLPDNERMLDLCRRLGFEEQHDAAAGDVRVRLRLG